MYKVKLQGWKKHIDFMALDILCLILGYVLSYMLYNSGELPFGVQGYLNLGALLVLMDFGLMIINSTLGGVMRRGFYKEFSVTVKHVFLVEVLLFTYLYAMKLGGNYSRLVLFTFGGLYFLLSYGVRLLWKKVLLHRKSPSKLALYMITTCNHADDLVDRYLHMKPSSYRYVGLCIGDLDQSGEEIGGIPVNANKENVLSFLCREWVDEVVISVSDEDRHLYNELASEIVNMGITVHMELEKGAFQDWRRQEVEWIADRTVITTSLNMATTRQAIFKRTMDIIGGLAGSLVTLLLTVVLGPMIYIKSPGPIFFAQTRVGRNGKPFKCYKFRSMYMDAEARKAELMAQNRIGGGLMFKLDYDPRIIGCERLPDGTIKKGLGNFIRDWSLDEFPQFFNVLKGDMSLVGTRPPTMDEWEKYELHHRARLAIKPGITGMWQVSGRSKITDFEQVIALDKQYIQQWSMGLDFRILLKTVKAVLKRDGSM